MRFLKNTISITVSESSLQYFDDIEIGREFKTELLTTKKTPENTTKFTGKLISFHEQKFHFKLLLNLLIFTCRQIIFYYEFFYYV